MIYFCNFYIFSPYLAGSCLSRHAFRPEKCSVRLLLRDEIIRKRHKYDAADHISKRNDCKIVEETAKTDRCSIHHTDGEEGHIGNAVLETAGNKGSHAAEIHRHFRAL